MSLSEIETPAIIVDVAALERNITMLADRIAAHDGRPVALRPHAKAHKSVEIALLQIASGAVGVCCQTVGEVEAMIEGGIKDVLLSNEIAGAAKARRLAKLATRGKITVCVDDRSQVDHLSRAAAEANTVLHVLVEIDVGAARCGVQPGEPAVALARYVATQPALRFTGVQAYNGAAQHLRQPAERATAISRAADMAYATVLALNEAGFHDLIVTGGGTGTFENELTSGVYTELQCGSYALMDVDYRLNHGGMAFGNALFVLTTIISAPVPGRAVCDGGLKAVSVDSGLPEVYGMPGVIYQTASDEHGTLSTQNETLPIGKQLLLVPGHCDPTVNMHDWIVAVREGHVQEVWKVARAR